MEDSPRGQSARLGASSLQPHHHGNPECLRRMLFSCFIIVHTRQTNRQAHTDKHTNKDKQTHIYSDKHTVCRGWSDAMNVTVCCHDNE
jgi:hypothetical protein